MRETGIGTSLILIATGAVLAFAIRIQSTAVDIQAIGAILIAVGLIGLLLSFVLLGSWAANRYVDGPPYDSGRIETHDIVYRDNEGTTTHVDREQSIRH